MATKQTTEEHHRPDFNISEFETEFNDILLRYSSKEDGADPPDGANRPEPRFLDLMDINSSIISLGEEYMYGVVTNRKRKDNKVIPYEVAVASYFTHFLQTQADLTNPAMIKDFALLFRRTVRKHAVRFIIDDGDERKVYVNASLGEFDEALYNSALPKIKLIMMMTAFYTRSCLTSGTNVDPINHIVDNNHTIEYQTDVILRNAIQCMNNALMPLDWLREFIKEHFVRGDIHTRGGTVLNGNEFPTLQKEVNDDQPLADFCAEFQDQFELDEPIVFNGKKVTHCQPILIDMIMGILNMSLFSAFLHALGLTPHIFLASKRSEIIFRPNGEGKGEYKLGPRDPEVGIIAQGTHPNSVEQHLSKRVPPEIIQLDEGISEVLKPLNGVPIRVIGYDGEESDAFFNWGPSDFFQRLYILRLSGDIQLNDIDYKQLKKAKDELEAMQAELEAEKEELEVAKADLDKAEVQLKEREATARVLKKEVKDQERARKRAKEDQEAAKAKEAKEVKDQERARKRAEEDQEAAKAEDLLSKYCKK